MRPRKVSPCPPSYCPILRSIENLREEVLSVGHTAGLTVQVSPQSRHGHFASPVSPQYHEVFSILIILTLYEVINVIENIRFSIIVSPEHQSTHLWYDTTSHDVYVY